MKKKMYRDTSSEESEKESDGGSDYEVSENSDGNVDGDNGSLENKAMNTRRRAKPVMMSISEAIKMRPRNSGISIREPTETPILVGPPWQQRLPRNTLRRPAQRFNNPIVASSSSAANTVPVAISSQAQVNNVSGRTITTYLIPQVNANTGNITTSLESGLNPSSSSINQDSFFGSSSSVNLHRSNSVSDPIPTNTLPFPLWSSSSGSNIINRPSSVNLHRPNSASHPIPMNTFPFPLGLSNTIVQGHVNITRQMTSSSQPWLSLVMPNYQQQLHDPYSTYFSLQGLDQVYRGISQHYHTGMGLLTTTMQQAYELRPQLQLLQHERRLTQHYLRAMWPIAAAMQRSYDVRQQFHFLKDGRGLTQHYLRAMAPIAAAMQRPYGLRNQPPLLQHGRGLELTYGGLTQPYLTGMAPLATTMQRRPYGLRNQPPLLQHGRGLDLNQSANEDNEGKKVEEEDQRLDLNQPLNEDDDEKKDESLDLNQPANEDDDGKKDEGLDLNQPASDV